MVLTLPREREISLTARMIDPSPLPKLIKVGGVNAAEVCGIPAHHLLITMFGIVPPDMANMNATTDHGINIELLYSPSPLRGSPEVDFDALLDVLGGEDPPPARVSSWRDLPGLL